MASSHSIPTSSQHPIVSKRSVTMVVGNLDGLGGLAKATDWLTERLQSLSAPAPSKVYTKGDFRGIIFAEFGSTDARDQAVLALRGAALTNGDKKVWASEDRSPAQRAARNFCLGFKRVLKEQFQVQDRQLEDRLLGERAMLTARFQNLRRAAAVGSHARANAGSFPAGGGG